MPRRSPTPAIASSSASTSTPTGTDSREVGDRAQPGDADTELTDGSRDLVHHARTVLPGQLEMDGVGLGDVPGLLDLLGGHVQPLIAQEQQVGEQLVDSIVAGLHHDDPGEDTGDLRHLAALPVAVVEPNHVRQRCDDPARSRPRMVNTSSIIPPLCHSARRAHGPGRTATVPSTL